MKSKQGGEGVGKEEDQRQSKCFMRRRETLEAKGVAVMHIDEKAPRSAVEYALFFVERQFSRLCECRRGRGDEFKRIEPGPTGLTHGNGERKGGNCHGQKREEGKGGCKREKKERIIKILYPYYTYEAFKKSCRELFIEEKQRIRTRYT